LFSGEKRCLSTKVDNPSQPAPVACGPVAKHR